MAALADYFLSLMLEKQTKTTAAGSRLRARR
jgi:hypothetical protein